MELLQTTLPALSSAADSCEERPAPSEQVAAVSLLEQNIHKLKARLFATIHNSGLNMNKIATETGMFASALSCMFADTSSDKISLPSLVRIAKATVRLRGSCQQRVDTKQEGPYPMFADPLKIEEDLPKLRRAVLISMQEAEITQIRLARAMMVSNTMISQRLSEKGFANMSVSTLLDLLSALRCLKVDLDGSHFLNTEKAANSQAKMPPPGVSDVSYAGFVIDIGKPWSHGDIKVFRHMKRMLKEKPDMKGLKSVYCEFRGLCTFRGNGRLATLTGKWLMHRRFCGPALSVDELAELAYGQGLKRYGADQSRAIAYALRCFRVMRDDPRFDHCHRAVMRCVEK